MKKQQLNESLKKIKYLTEFHFKAHTREEAGGEQPVKFNEIGDVYKHHEEENDYPTFEQYRDEVMIDEEDPIDGQQQPQQQAPAPEQQPATAPQDAQQTVPAGQIPPDANIPPATPEPAPQPDMAAPAPAPMPEPAPMPQAPDPQDMMFSALEAKTDEMLAKFDMLQQQLAGVENVNLKLNDVEKKLDDLTDPPYQDQLEMISKKAYPYNVKLSDFWGWDKEEEPVDVEQTFKLSPEDINSYNKDDIKKSFGA